MTVKNGCWNCIHGGNLKILRTLLKSLSFAHDIHLTKKCKNEIQAKINLDENRCVVDNGYQAETGFMCDKWVYDNCGWQE